MLFYMLIICFFSNIGKAFETNQDLNDSKSLWKIGVRVLDLWSVANSKNKQHIKMGLYVTNMCC